MMSRLGLRPILIEPLKRALRKALQRLCVRSLTRFADRVLHAAATVKVDIVASFTASA